MDNTRKDVLFVYTYYMLDVKHIFFYVLSLKLNALPSDMLCHTHI